jgi:hypothetical protein
MQSRRALIEAEESSLAAALPQAHHADKWIKFYKLKKAASYASLSLRTPMSERTNATDWEPMREPPTRLCPVGIPAR